MSPPTSSPQTPTPITTFLRKTTIWIFLPAFPILLAHGIKSHQVLPALGLVPLAGSALLNAYRLYRGRSPTQPRMAANAFYADALLAATLLGLLIGSWVVLTRMWWRDISVLMLGTYGTVFMIIDCGIHFYFLFQKALQRLRLTAWACDCPHCKSVSKRSGRSFLQAVSEYSLLHEADVDDDEEAYRDVETTENERTGL